eukprot:6637638-Lingulodinium_polyedra.AAC.1
MLPPPSPKGAAAARAAMPGCAAGADHGPCGAPPRLCCKAETLPHQRSAPHGRAAAALPGLLACR